MPRKNKSPKHVPFRFARSPVAKRRFPTHAAAQKAADEQMLLKPDLVLYVYQDIDGGWYLTRKEHGSGK